MIEIKREDYSILTPFELEQRFLDLLPKNIIKHLKSYFLLYKITLYKFAMPALTEHDMYNLCIKNYILAFGYTILKEDDTLVCYIRVLPYNDFDRLLQVRYISAEKIQQGPELPIYYVKKLYVKFTYTSDCIVCMKPCLNNYCINIDCKQFKLINLQHVVVPSNEILLSFNELIEKFKHHSINVKKLCNKCKKCKICQRYISLGQERKCAKHVKCICK